MTRAVTLLLGLLLVAPGARAEFSTAVEDGLVRLGNGENIRATVAPRHGGELSGMELYFGGAWRELVYRANDYGQHDGWRGKAPLLWPAVGMTLDPGGEGRGYRVGGVHYPMPAHGFARDHAWRVVGRGVEEDHARVTLSLSSDDETRALYPFEFELQVTYRVFADRLTIDYAVRAGADNSASMPFCIGNHVTFRAPLLPGSRAGDVRFETALPDYLERGADRTFSGRVEPSPFRGEHPLSALPRRSMVAPSHSKSSSAPGTTSPPKIIVRFRALSKAAACFVLAAVSPIPAGSQLLPSHSQVSSPPAVPPWSTTTFLERSKAMV